MDQELSDLQDEVKILKNEIKGTLVGIRDYFLTNIANPFPTETRQAAPVSAPTQLAAAPSPYPIIASGGSGTSDPAPAAAPAPVMPAPSSAAIPNTAPNSAQPTVARPKFDAIAQTSPAPSPQFDVPTPPDSIMPQPHIAQMRSQEEGTDSAPYRREEAPLAEIGHQAKPAGRGPESEADGASPDNLYGTSQQSEPNQPAPTRTPQEEENRGVPDLLVVATLASWIEDGASRIGRERLQSLVDIYSSMKGLSPQLYEILTKLIALDGTPEPVDPVTLRDCMRILADLDSLLQRSRADHTNAALLFSLMSRGARANEGHKKPIANGNGDSGLASLLAL